MGQCTKPGGFAACNRDSCIDCRYHIVEDNFKEFIEELDSDEIKKYTRQIQEHLKKITDTLSDKLTVPLIETTETPTAVIKLFQICSHSTILVSEYGYVCQDCRKQMKLVGDKFVEM